MTAESDLRRYRDRAVQLRTQISKASGTVAEKRKKVAAARAAATKTKSDATRRSKFREAEVAEKAANDAEKKRSDLEKKLADVEKSIRQEIEKGIAHARFGVVILSPNFFAKQGTQSELDALFSKKMTTGDNLILPIWHRVTKDQVQANSPLLAGILALNTSLTTVDEIADSLVDVVRP